MPVKRSRSGRDGNAPVVIAGAGLTGLSAALKLGAQAITFEGRARPGGLAVSENVDGYTFDRTGHWMHVSDSGLKRQLKRWLPADQWVTVSRKSRAFSHGVTAPYPFQVHLHGQPPEILYDCLLGLWKMQSRGRKRRRKIQTFEDFICAHFGEGIARHFLIPYNEKIWGVHPREMTAAWCRKFVPVPRVEQILAGASGKAVDELGYNVRFMYPRAGGIDRLPQAMAARLDPKRIHCSSPVEKVDHKKRRVRVSGEWMGYRALLSTMPLPELCNRLAEPPASVIRAAGKLRWTPVLYLDLATSAPTAAEYHWVYVPERKYPFYRVGIYSNAVPSMAPAGCASLYVELASRDRNRAANVIERDIAQGLTEVGVLSGPETVRFTRLQTIEYAYVIYDRNTNAARASLLSFFKRHGIYSCGRYGSWVYNAMQDSLLEGARMGETLRRSRRKAAK